MRFMEDTKLTEARRFVLGNYIVQKVTKYTMIIIIKTMIMINGCNDDVT